jgi:glycosidase
MLQVVGVLTPTTWRKHPKFMKKLIIFLFVSISLHAQDLRVEPLSWWTGMKNTQLQLMVHGKDIKGSEIIAKRPGLKIVKVHSADSPNYLFIDCEITKNTPAGSYPIDIKKAGKVIHHIDYVLKARDKNSANRPSYTTKDVIYLITPDRFANGDPRNDAAPGFREPNPARNEMYGRHGGDLKGISDRLDYIHDMGFTAIWSLPVQTNDQAKESYHGYAITDHYAIDPRFGTNNDYKNLADKARQKGIKLIMDVVLNHCGDGHWWMKDFPFKDWINFDGKFVSTTHRRETVQDPHVSKYDAKMQSEGWFVPAMPDLNQKNPFMAKYLIQNTIWWIEYAHLGGIRIDTYPYSEKQFAAQWSDAVLAEYPNLNLVGEEWSSNPIITSYWQKGKVNRDGFKSSLPALMDFPLQNALTDAMNENDQDWGKGLNKIYSVLSNDLVYANPDNLVVFGDNHDMSRFYTQVKHDQALFRMGITFLMTTRGIPQIFYGTENLMSNPNSGEHGEIRGDFYGGWPGDAKDALTQRGFTADEKSTQDFFKKLLNWRKNNPVIHEGKLLHFGPENGVYVYFRYTNSGKVMIVLNKNTQEKVLDVARYTEMIKPGATMKEVLTDNQFTLGNQISIAGKTAMILEVK